MHINIDEMVARKRSHMWVLYSSSTLILAKWWYVRGLICRSYIQVIYIDINEMVARKRSHV